MCSSPAKKTLCVGIAMVVSILNNEKIQPNHNTCSIYVKWACFFACEGQCGMQLNTDLSDMECHIHTVPWLRSAAFTYEEDWHESATGNWHSGCHSRHPKLWKKKQKQTQSQSYQNRIHDRHYDTLHTYRGTVEYTSEQASTLVIQTLKKIGQSTRPSFISPRNTEREREGEKLVAILSWWRRGGVWWRRWAVGVSRPRAGSQIPLLLLAYTMCGCQRVPPGTRAELTGEHRVK